MTARTTVHRLQVATVLHRFIEDQVLPGTGVDAAAFDPLFKAMEGSVTALRAAIKGGGDAAAIDAARKAIKPAYSRMFLKFG